MHDRTTANSEVRKELLKGIWLLGASDLARQSEWLYRICNVLIRGVSEVVGGKSVSITRVPRRSGIHRFEFHLVGDIAQCLRYARSEGQMTKEYVEEVADSIATALGTRAIDLVELGGFELRTVVLPVPEFDWEGVADHVVPQIILAARGRRLLEAKKPIPLPLATALSGWSEKELMRFEEPETGTKMSSRKRKGIRYFDSKTFDLLMQTIENVFFDHRVYKPL